MNDWERAICSRVKTIREQIRWSQPDFAKQIRISRDQLAAIEVGRTPLRYDVAWRIHEEFGVSLNWLDEEFGFADDTVASEIQFPRPGSPGLPSRALLSTVAKAVHDASAASGEWSKVDAKSLSAVMTDGANRWLNLTYLEIFSGEWIASVPPGQATALVDLLTATARKFIASFPPEPEQEIEKRANELIWRRLRIANARKFLFSPKRPLTEVTELGKCQSVKLNMENLLARLNRATSQTGMKSKLAKHMGVPLSNVSQWLSGKREPGGEITLKLLNWVEQQEHSTK